MLSILLFLWTQASGPPGTFDSFYRFGPDDVHRLAMQLRSSLTMPHRLVVISDLPAHAFCSDLVHVDLVRHFGELRALGGCWLRLKCFAPELEPVLGQRWAWIDLDSVIVGNLDPLLDRPEPLVLYRSDSIIGQNWNGSFVLGGVGSARIWAEFDPSTAPLMIKHARRLRNGGTSRLGGPRGTDQAWLHLICPPQTPSVSARDGVLYWQPGRYPVLPRHARMVTFAGAMKPSNWRVNRYSPWMADFYPGPVAIAGEPLPHLPELAVENAPLPLPPRKISVVNQERRARLTRRKIKLGREFAPLPRQVGV
jgi:hypothetical protein